MGLLFGAFAKGTTGLGFPLITIPIIALVLDPRSAVVTTTIPNLLINVLILLRGGVALAEARRVLPVLLVGLVGTALGVKVLSLLDTSLLSILLGTLAIIYVFSNWFEKIELSPRWERRLAPLVGLGAGFLQGSTGASGPALAIYFHSLHLPKRHFVFLITSVFMMYNLIQFGTIYAMNLYTTVLWLYSFAFLVPSFAGLMLGFFTQDRLNQKVFNRVVLVVLFGTGSNLVLRGLRVL